MKEMKYKLIHIDTLEVTLCEKITIDNEDYYVSIEKKHNGYVYNTLLTQLETMFEGKNFVDAYKGLIATTNTSLLCPQVVDYVEELAESHYGTDIDSYRSSKPFDLEGDRKQGFVKGYQKHSETHSLSNEEVCLFAEYFYNYWNDMTSEEFIHSECKNTTQLLTQFKSTLPIKIYFR